MTRLGLWTLGRNTVMTLGSQLCAALLQLATLAIIGRVYGPQGTGVYAVALLLPSVLSTFLNLGLAPANVYFVGAKQVSVALAWRDTFRLSMITCLFGLALGSVAVSAFGPSWLPDVPDPVLWIALAAFPFILIFGLVSSLLQALQMFRSLNLIRLLPPAVALACLSGLTLTGYRGMEGVLLSVLLGHLIAAGSAVTVLRSVLRSKRDERSKRSAYTGPALRYGMQAHLSNILAFLAHKLDLFLVNLFVGPAAAGIYAIAIQLVERLWLPSQAASLVLLPRLAELSEDEEKRKVLTPLATRAILLGTSAAALLLGVASVLMVPLIFGPEFAGSLEPLAILLPGIVLSSAGRVLANDTAARGRPDLNTYLAAFGVALNLAGNVWLIPIYGVNGAALSTTVSYAIRFAIRLVVQQRLTGVPWFANILPTSEDLVRLKSLRSRA